MLPCLLSVFIFRWLKRSNFLSLNTIYSVSLPSNLILWYNEIHFSSFDYFISTSFSIFVLILTPEHVLNWFLFLSLLILSWYDIFFFNYPWKNTFDIKILYWLVNWRHTKTLLNHIQNRTILCWFVIRLKL